MPDTPLLLVDGQNLLFRAWFGFPPSSPRSHHGRGALIHPHIGIPSAAFIGDPGGQHIDKLESISWYFQHNIDPVAPPPGTRRSPGMTCSQPMPSPS